MNSVTGALLGLLLMGFPVSDRVGPGVAALREGRPVEALELLERALQAKRDQGRAPRPALLFDLGLAALRAGRPEAARAAFLEARASTGPGDPARGPAGLGLGAALWRLSEEAENAGPSGLPEALDRSREAREAWIRTLVEGDGLEPVRRNIERANARIERLEELLQEQESQERSEESEESEKSEQEEEDRGEREEREQNVEEPSEQEQEGESKSEQEPEPESKQEPDQEQKNNQAEEESEQARDQPAPEQEKPEMSPEELRQLMDRLEKLEARRLELERLRRPARPQHGRDW